MAELLACALAPVIDTIDANSEENEEEDFEDIDLLGDCPELLLTLKEAFGGAPDDHPGDKEEENGSVAASDAVSTISSNMS